MKPVATSPLNVILNSEFLYFMVIIIKIKEMLSCSPCHITTVKKEYMAYIRGLQTLTT